MNEGGGSRGGGGHSGGHSGGHHHRSHHHGGHYGHHHHHRGGHHHYDHHHHHHYGHGHGHSHYSSSGGGIVITKQCLTSCPRISAVICCTILFLIAFILILALAPWKTDSSSTNLYTFQTQLIHPSSATWKKSIKVSTDSPSYLKVFKFNSPPPISSTFVNISIPLSFTINFQDYHFFSFELPPSSSLSSLWQLQNSPTSLIDFYVIVGQNNFDSWKNSTIQKSWVYHNPANSDSTPVFTNKDGANTYFLVWENDIANPKVAAVIKGNVSLSLSTYNLDHPVDECNRVAVCEMDIDRGEDNQVFILQAVEASDKVNGTMIEEVGASQDGAINVRWEIEPRKSLYWGIWAPIVSVAFCCLLVCSCGMGAWYIVAKNKKGYDQI
eukprot:TRINITY_DN457_c0_g1_i1.p1 TRINITY_DN457_c0_g1~~TRINITY_DN457_c0_g1_i1.p1  ORF type:complete len:382 (-),score=88.42 TRINITY_DN457_c0_g1_i1:37-1182(-)